MDALDRLAEPASDLLARVDDTLARAGAPAGHPVWPLVLRLRALPGAAAGAFAAARTAPLASASTVLRTLIREYEETGAALTVGTDWRGAGAEAFAGQWLAMRAHLDGGAPHDLVSRLRRTVSYVDALVDWLAQSRDAVARTLARVLASAEAVSVWTESAPEAAAEIAVDVLGALAEVHDRGAALRDEFGADLGELIYRAPAPGGPSAGSTTVVPL
jgi:hypothetical protein